MTEDKTRANDAAPKFLAKIFLPYVVKLGKQVREKRNNLIMNFFLVRIPFCGELFSFHCIANIRDPDMNVRVFIGSVIVSFERIICSKQSLFSLYVFKRTLLMCARESAVCDIRSTAVSSQLANKHWTLENSSYCKFVFC